MHYYVRTARGPDVLETFLNENKSLRIVTITSFPHEDDYEITQIYTVVFAVFDEDES